MKSNKETQAAFRARHLAAGRTELRNQYLTDEHKVKAKAYIKRLQRAK